MMEDAIQVLKAHLTEFVPAKLNEQNDIQTATASPLYKKPVRDIPNLDQSPTPTNRLGLVTTTPASPEKRSRGFLFRRKHNPEESRNEQDLRLASSGPGSPNFRQVGGVSAGKGYSLQYNKARINAAFLQLVSVRKRKQFSSALPWLVAVAQICPDIALLSSTNVVSFINAAIKAFTESNYQPENIYQVASQNNEELLAQFVCVMLRLFKSANSHSHIEGTIVSIISELNHLKHNSLWLRTVASYISVVSYKTIEEIAETLIVTCENMCEGMADVVVQICRLEPTDMRRQCFFGLFQNAILNKCHGESVAHSIMALLVEGLEKEANLMKQHSSFPTCSISKEFHIETGLILEVSGLLEAYLQTASTIRAKLICSLLNSCTGITRPASKYLLNPALLDEFGWISLHSIYHSIRSDVPELEQDMYNFVREALKSNQYCGTFNLFNDFETLSEAIALNSCLPIHSNFDERLKEYFARYALVTAMQLECIQAMCHENGLYHYVNQRFSLNASLTSRPLLFPSNASFRSKLGISAYVMQTYPFYHSHVFHALLPLIEDLSEKTDIIKLRLVMEFFTVVMNQDIAEKVSQVITALLMRFHQLFLVLYCKSWEESTETPFLTSKLENLASYPHFLHKLNDLLPVLMMYKPATSKDCPAFDVLTTFINAINDIIRETPQVVDNIDIIISLSIPDNRTVVPPPHVCKTLRLVEAGFRLISTLSWTKWFIVYSQPASAETQSVLSEGRDANDNMNHDQSEISLDIPDDLFESTPLSSRAQSVRGTSFSSINISYSREEQMTRANISGKSTPGLITSPHGITSPPGITATRLSAALSASASQPRSGGLSQRPHVKLSPYHRTRHRSATVRESTPSNVYMNPPGSKGAHRVNELEHGMRKLMANLTDALILRLPFFIIHWIIGALYAWTACWRFYDLLEANVCQTAIPKAIYCISRLGYRRQQHFEEVNQDRCEGTIHDLFLFLGGLFSTSAPSKEYVERLCERDILGQHPHWTTATLMSLVFNFRENMSQYTYLIFTRLVEACFLHVQDPLNSKSRFPINEITQLTYLNTLALHIFSIYFLMLSLEDRKRLWEKICENIEKCRFQTVSSVPALHRHSFEQRAKIMLDLVKSYSNIVMQHFAGRELVYMPFPLVFEDFFPKYRIYRFCGTGQLVVACVNKKGWALFKCFTPTLSEAFSMDLSSLVSEYQYICNGLGFSATEDTSPISPSSIPHTTDSSFQATRPFESDNNDNNDTSSARQSKNADTNEQIQSFLHDLQARSQPISGEDIIYSLPLSVSLNEHIDIDEAFQKQLSSKRSFSGDDNTIRGANERSQSISDLDFRMPSPYPDSELELRAQELAVESAVNSIFRNEVTRITGDDAKELSLSFEQRTFFESEHFASVVFLPYTGAEWHRYQQPPPARYCYFLDALGERVIINSSSRTQYPSSVRIWQRALCQLNFVVVGELHRQTTEERISIVNNCPICILYCDGDWTGIPADMTSEVVSIQVVIVIQPMNTDSYRVWVEQQDEAMLATPNPKKPTMVTNSGIANYLRQLVLQYGLALRANAASSQGVWEKRSALLDKIKDTM